jgi:trans-2,3-dihydro-3-hydroxyanthranilate isomerase
MSDYRYRILNVFALDRDKLSGNPLCVFEDGRGLDGATMQALALQFNLSETTFIFPSEKATAHARIFTPTFEMPFAGHPTLGTAHVVRALAQCGDRVTLDLKAGVIPVDAAGDTWTLRANPPRWRAADAHREQLAEMLGIEAADVGDKPLWVDTGSEQLVIPLAAARAVDRCVPVQSLLIRYGRINDARYLAYVWAPVSDTEIRARFFFAKGSAIAEDPATGSACANLGGWFIATGAKLPVSVRVRQGDAVGRPSSLGLHVDTQKQIYVSGEVIELGGGIVSL